MWLGTLSPGLWGHILLYREIRLRCQKGIPPSLRGRAWQYLSGSKVKLEQNMGKFDELDLLPGDPKWLDVIERDLHRQFPFHEMFVSRGGHGQQDLFRVLKAYTLYRPEEGYCQAQAPIAAVLLMHMPAEQAFWCLVQICEKYLPGYYSEKLEAIQLDGQILFSLLHKVSPVAYKHLSKQKIDPILYMTEWFMCAFSRTLPWSSVLRVWDMFFCEGVKIIFRVGLVLLKHTLGSSDKLKSCQGQYETMERLRALSPKIMQETFLVQEVRCWGEWGGPVLPSWLHCWTGLPLGRQSWCSIGGSAQKARIWGCLCPGGYPTPCSRSLVTLALPREMLMARVCPCRSSSCR
uniref:Rab-GAP TBC domain-containing protein n=1 Tax=Bubo bubo TaxID=30461 RepID=A0A8C0EYT8_BUBBB